MITGLLAIVAGAIVFNVSLAVPRYSASVPQIDDSSNAVTAQQGDSKMNNERVGIEKAIMVDALKGCRDGATIGIVSGSLRGGIAGGAAGGLPGAVAGASAGAASGAAAGCVKGMITGVAKGAAVRAIKDIQSESNETNGEQDGAINETSPSSSTETSQNPNAPILQRITQESQSCQSPQTYVTCAYTRLLDDPTVGKVAEAALGDRGVHWQIVIYNGKTGEQIASYGKTTKPIVDGSSVAGSLAGGAVGAGVGALEGRAYGQGVVTLDSPTKNPEYAAYRQEPVWCIESNEISVLKPGYYEVLDTDCREYAGRVKNDLLYNKGGREIPAPQYTILKTTCSKIDTSKLEVLLNERINMVERFIARVKQGERLGERDKSLYEGNVKETLLELQCIDEQIKRFDVSDDERKQIEKQTIAQIESLAKRVEELEKTLTKLIQDCGNSSVCMCKDPSPDIVIPILSDHGWAKCKSCKKIIGTILVSMKDGKVSVSGKNPIAKAMVGKMVKESMAAKRK